MPDKKKNEYQEMKEGMDAKLSRINGQLNGK